MFRVEIAIAKVIGVPFPHFNGNILYIYIYTMSGRVGF